MINDEFHILNFSHYISWLLSMFVITFASRKSSPTIGVVADLWWVSIHEFFLEGKKKDVEKYGDVEGSEKM